MKVNLFKSFSKCVPWELAGRCRHIHIHTERHYQKMQDRGGVGWGAGVERVVGGGGEGGGQGGWGVGE